MSDVDALPDRHRVFFALWPDDATRAAISRATREAVRSSGGRPIAKDRLHLTVAFLGELTAAGLDGARRVPPIAVGPFELTLDTVGIWPESKILWLAPSSPPNALGELEGQLWDTLAERGFRAEDRVYRPHLTLARRARRRRRRRRGRALGRPAISRSSNRFPTAATSITRCSSAGRCRSRSTGQNTSIAIQ